MPSSLPSLKGVSIFLVGMMGVGKSTVGKILAQTLGYGFCDTDRVITQASDRSISELFAEIGESQFRQLEHQVLGEISAHTRLVVPTGGGIILRQDNWGYLRHGVVVWLDMPPVEIMARLKSNPTELAQRPLLKTPDPLATLTRLYEQRRMLYAQADIHVDAQGSPPQVCDRLINLLHSQLKPCYHPSSSA